MGKVTLEFPDKDTVKWGIHGKGKKDILKTMEGFENFLEKQK